MSAEEAIRKQYCNITKEEVQVRDVALTLRDAIMSAETKDLPENLTVKDITEGEVQVPPIVNEFFSYLIGGPVKKNGKILERREESSLLAKMQSFQVRRE